MTELDWAVYHMLQVWKQYNTLWGRGDPDDFISHACMTVGEDAAEFLEEHGYVVDEGWGVRFTEKGKLVLKQGWSMMNDPK